MKIPDTEIEPPSTREHARQDRRRCFASAVKEAAAGIVGADRAGRSARVPPSRATATAALAAQPPVVATRSLARILVPGAGKLLDLEQEILDRDAGAQHHRRVGAASGEVNAVLHPVRG